MLNNALSSSDIVYYLGSGNKLKKCEKCYLCGWCDTKAISKKMRIFVPIGESTY